MHLVQKEASVQESLGLASTSSSSVQPACCQFPTFRLSCILPQTACVILRKNRPDLIWFWLTVSGFGQNSDGSGPEASQCARIIRPASGRCFRADPDLMRSDAACFLGMPPFQAGLGRGLRDAGHPWGRHELSRPLRRDSTAGQCLLWLRDERQNSDPARRCSGPGR